MKPLPLIAVLPALVLTVAAEAREYYPQAAPVSGPAVAGVSGPAGSDHYFADAHRLIFDAGDARTALAKAFATRRQGKVEFSLRAAGIDRDIAADCDITASRYPANRGMPEPAPSAVTCRFYGAGKSQPARLVLEEKRSCSLSVRQGELRIDGLELQIAARESNRGPQHTNGGPSEYVFTIDGVAVGAVDLAGRPVVRLAAGQDERTRRAVMLGATALGVLWSPQGTGPALATPQRPIG